MSAPITATNFVPSDEEAIEYQDLDPASVWSVQVLYVPAADATVASPLPVIFTVVPPGTNAPVDVNSVAPVPDKVIVAVVVLVPSSLPLAPMFKNPVDKL